MSPLTPGPAKPPVASPSGSLAGWSFRTWLTKQKSILKTIAAGAVGFVTFKVGLIHDPNLNAAAAGAAALLGRFVADFIDYWLSDVGTGG